MAQIKITQDTDIEKYSRTKNSGNIPKKSGGEQVDIQKLKCAQQAILSIVYDLVASGKL